MSEIEVFRTAEFELKIQAVGDSFHVAAPGLARALGFAEARDLIRSIPGDEKGSEIAPTPGGDQRAWYLTEPGFYRAIGQRQSSRIKDTATRELVERFQRWVYSEVLPAIRRTGRYEPSAGPAADVARLDRRALALMVIEAEDARLAAIERADAADRRAAELEPAAQNWEAVQAGDGITLRTFHKKYFSAVGERELFEHLYSRGYLIDQRGKGTWDDERQKHRDGRQHRHPSYKGKPYLYLHAEMDRNEVRRENTRVIPGEPELAFRARLIREGLPPNQSGTDIERRAA